MDILHFEDLGDISVVSDCSLGVNLVIDNLLSTFRYFTYVYNLKAIGQLLMDILHFYYMYLGDTRVVWPRAQLF